MWQYGDPRGFRHALQPAGVGAQSSYDLLLALRGAAITLLYLNLNEPGRPVTQLSGFIELVSTASLTLGLAAGLPRQDPKTRYGVEVMSGPSILRFQATAHRPPEAGTVRLELALPRQVETVQRRKFSRAPVHMAVAFSPGLGRDSPSAGHGGLGHSLDLSAGGLRFITQTPLRYGDQLFVSFNTPDGTAFRGLAAKVVRAQPDGTRFTVSLQFSDLEDAVESLLAQTVFRLQLKGPAQR